MTAEAAVSPPAAGEAPPSRLHAQGCVKDRQTLYVRRRCKVPATTNCGLSSARAQHTLCSGVGIHVWTFQKNSTAMWEAVSVNMVFDLAGERGVGQRTADLPRCAADRGGNRRGGGGARRARGDASTWLGGTERLPGSTGLVGTSRLIRVNPPCCATQNRSSGSCMARSCNWRLGLVNLAPSHLTSASLPPDT